tara:strand:- start:296 stop:1069 length:774 start_codon:yes stop_codon:yes gene_type:complete
MKKKYIKLPKISIITVVLNGDKTINKCIKSVIAQSYPSHKIEHVIIDGGSQDKTTSIIKRYQHKIAYWHSKKDKGLYDAMNIGLKKCTGNIIGILNSDDFFNKNTLKIVSKYFIKYKIDFLFGSVKKSRIYHNFFPEKLWYTFNIYPAHSVGFFIKKSAQKKVGNFNIKFKYSADRDFLYRLIKNKKFNGMAVKKREVFGKFCLQGASSRVGFLEKNIEEIRIRISNNENIFKVLLFFLIYLNYYFIKKIIRFFRYV